MISFSSLSAFRPILHSAAATRPRSLSLFHECHTLCSTQGRFYATTCLHRDHFFGFRLLYGPFCLAITPLVHVFLGHPSPFVPNSPCFPLSEATRADQQTRRGMPCLSALCGLEVRGLVCINSCLSSCLVEMRTSPLGNEISHDALRYSHVLFA